MNKKTTNKSKKNINSTKIDIEEFIKNIDKKKIIISIIIVILLLGGFLLVREYYSNHNDKMNDLVITYKDGKSIKFKKFKKEFTEKRTITIKNISKENKTYSLEWKDVSNSLEQQNKFTYEIKCTGDRCATLGTSQVPVAGFQVFPQALIEAGKTQTYTIEFKYNGSEKGVKFKGKLIVYSEKPEEEQESKDDEKETKTGEDFNKDLKKTKENKTKSKA